MRLNLSAAINISTHIRPFSSIGVSNWQPQTDGRITAHEAAYWHRNGDGRTQSVPLDSIDFQGVQSIPSEIGKEIRVELVGKDYSNFSDAAVYGELRLKLVAPNTVEYLSGAEFGFEHHPDGSTFRNTLTLFGRFSLGKGQPFDIDLIGRARIF